MLVNKSESTGRTSQYDGKILNSRLEVTCTLQYLRCVFCSLESALLLIECVHLLALCFLCCFLLEKFLFSLCGAEYGAPGKRDNYLCFHLELISRAGGPK